MEWPSKASVECVEEGNVCSDQVKPAMCRGGMCGVTK